MILGTGLIALAAALTLPALAAPVPPACVVVNSAAHLQVGYAPTGPAGCTQLP